MTLNSFLKWTAIGALCAALFTPLVVADSLFFPFIVGKALFFRSLVEIAFAAWVLLTLRDSSARPRMSALLWAFIAFVVVVGLADAFGVNAWKSFWSNFERMEGYITILHVFLYFLVASAVLNTEKLWKMFLEISIGSSVLVSLYGLLQLGGKVAVNQGGVRLDATLGNATYLAVYLLFNIFFALILMTRGSVMWKKALLAIIVVVHTIVLYNTGTRGAALGLIGGIAVTALLVALFDKAEKKRRIVAASFIGAIIVVVGGFLAIRNADFVKASPVLSRFASITVADAKSQARYYIWPMAIEGWKEKPVFGWGQENFNYVFNKDYVPQLYGQEQWFDRAHNAPLDWLVETGALGFLGYLSLFVMALYLVWKRSPESSFLEKSLMTGLFAAYLFNNLFVFDNMSSYLMFAVALAFVQFRGTRLSLPLAKDAEDFDSSDTRIAGGLILIALIGSLYFFNYRAYASGATLIDALRDMGTAPMQADAAIAAFQKSLAYNTVGRPEIVERMVEGASQVNASDASLETKQKYYDITLAALKDQLERAPGDARYELFAGSFYATFKQTADAEKHYQEAVRLSPGKQTGYFTLGSFYIANKRYADASAAFKQAYELDKTNKTSAEYYAAGLIYEGKDDAARAIVAPFGEAEYTSDIFIQSYAGLGQWAKAIAIINARIAAEPNNLELYQNLAISYYQSGNKAMAIATFQKMAALNPSFKAQADQYIQQIQASN